MKCPVSLIDTNSIAPRLRVLIETRKPFAFMTAWIIRGFIDNLSGKIKMVKNVR